MKEFLEESLNEEKGATATTIGPHGRSKFTKKQRKEQKDKQKAKQNAEKPTEKPAGEPKKEEEQEERQDTTQKEEVKEEPNEETLDNAEISKDIIQAAAEKIVVDRINLFNRTLSKLYSIAGNLIYLKNEVFPIFTVSKIPDDKAENKAKNEPEQPKKQEKTVFRKKLESSITLFEEEERKEQDQSAEKVVKFKVAYAFPENTWTSNKFTKQLEEIRKSVCGSDESWDGLSNLGRLCFVVAKLVGKYTELKENLSEVNDKINFDEINIVSAQQNFALNNKLLKELLPIFQGTKGTIGLKVLNEFTARGLSKITASRTLDELLKLLPYAISVSHAKDVSTKEAFVIGLKQNSQEYRLFTSEKFKAIWLTGTDEKNEEEHEQDDNG